MIMAICDECGQMQSLPNTYLQCKECGGPLQIQPSKLISKDTILRNHNDIWRYSITLPFSNGYKPIVTFGEGNTPLLELSGELNNVLIKMEYKTNTHSFLDRGASVCVNYLKNMGVDNISTYSYSGDAAASIAAYSIVAGIRCTTWLGKLVSDEKKAQIRSYGASLVENHMLSPKGFISASEGHVVLPATDPLFIEGAKTISFEIWEQMGERIPDAVFVPLGHGSLLTGLYKGFKELLNAGEIKHIPVFVGVQLDNYSSTELETQFSKYNTSSSIAEGIYVEYPIRQTSIQTILRETGGYIETVTDKEIALAVKELGTQGFSTTPTGASGVAGYLKATKRGDFAHSRCVVPLTSTRSENEISRSISPYL